MQYIVRAVKYFVYICVLCAAILGILIACNFVEGNLDSLFVGGKDSLKLILIVFAILSALYPMIGYCTAKAPAGGTLSERRDAIVEYMLGKGYVVEKETPDSLSFRRKSFLHRLNRTFEDRITVAPEFGGFTVRGLRRDAVTLACGIENLFREAKPEE
ncbi:MAG: hypothetical protein MJY62_02100 [Bacteroidales bacterium]|nr:hypothetical protein [Bacteroidales bacterium]